MNSLGCIVVAFSLMTIIASLPVKPYYVDIEFKKCGPELINFANNICKGENMEIKNGKFEGSEKLLSECCLNKCSTSQILKDYCLEQRNSTENYSATPLITSTATPFSSDIISTSPSVTPFSSDIINTSTVTPLSTGIISTSSSATPLSTDVINTTSSTVTPLSSDIISTSSTVVSPLNITSTNEPLKIASPQNNTGYKSSVVMENPISTTRIINNPSTVEPSPNVTINIPSTSIDSTPQYNTKNKSSIVTLFPTSTIKPSTAISPPIRTNSKPLETILLPTKIDEKLSIIKEVMSLLGTIDEELDIWNWCRTANQIYGLDQ